MTLSFYTIIWTQSLKKFIEQKIEFIEPKIKFIVQKIEFMGQIIEFIAPKI
jgi:hypothetical protein